MLSEQEIKQVLRASRVAPMPILSPHGPFGLAQLANTVARYLERDATQEMKVVQSLEMSAETWQKLEQLADQATRSTTRPVSESEVAAAILQQYVAGHG
jgi:hypothetical protein